MKNYYDKVLFLLALIILGIGFGIFFQKGGVEQGRAIPALALSGKGYEVIPPPKIGNPDVSWPKPPDQGEENTDEVIGLGWVYYPFTPPKIYWDKEFGFVAEPTVGGPTPKIPPFGMKFVKAQEERYRVQLTGVGGTGEKDDIMIFSNEEDEDAPFHLSLKTDQTAESLEHQVKLLEVSYNDVSEHGLVSRVATAKILDERTNEVVSLTQGKYYSPSGNRFWLLHTEDPLPSEDWRITAVGDKREYPGDILGFTGVVTYEVTALDFDKPSVTLVRHSFNKRKVAVDSKPTELGGDVPDSTPPASDSPPTSGSSTTVQPTIQATIKPQPKPSVPASVPAAKPGAKPSVATTSASIK